MAMSPHRNEPQAAQVLDEVYAALVRSDFAGLAGLGQSLTLALDHLAPSITEADLRLIRRKADRNAACLLAAGRGIKAARRRLTEIRTTTQGLVTYDRSGKRAEISESRELVQRL